MLYNNIDLRGKVSAYTGFLLIFLGNVQHKHLHSYDQNQHFMLTTPLRCPISNYQAEMVLTNIICVNLFQLLITETECLLLAIFTFLLTVNVWFYY